MDGIPSLWATQRQWLPSVIIIIGSWNPFFKMKLLTYIQDDHYYRPFLVMSDLSNSLYSWRPCVFYHNFEIHVSNQMNQKYKIWPALLVFHFLWVHQVSPKNILLSIIKGWNALSKSWSLSLLSCAGVKLLINSLKDLLFDSLKTKLSPVLPKLMSSVS